MDAKLFVDLLLDFEEFLLDIHTAASIGCDERVRDIIDSSENKGILDEQNINGWTPLMYAACCANLKVVLLLLEEGADTDIKNCDGHTALILASKCGSGDVVNLLIDNGAKVNHRDHRGWTALFYATAFGHRSVVQLLIERGAKVDIVDDNEQITPLMLAAAAGHERIVQDLLQLGLNVNAKCKYGDTARSLAQKNGHVNVKNLIDGYLQSQRRNSSSNVRNQELPALLKELQLTKYYPVFHNHGIDLSTFWLLTDDDLKEMGIQLLGPRKKICMAISQHQEEQTQKSNLKENVDSIVMENKKLRNFNENLKAVILQEKNCRLVAERNLTDAIQSINNCSEILNLTISQVLDFIDNLKDGQDYFRRLLYTTFHNMPLSNNACLKQKVDDIFESLGCMQKLVDIHHENMICMQQKAVKNSFS